MSSSIKLVLASGSPRRRELLSGLGLEFEVQGSCMDESTDKTDPVEIVSYLSLAKAQEVACKLKENAAVDARVLVLGADTIVVLDSKILGKPQSRQEAFDMLMSLSGREHKVYTGVSIVQIPEGTEETIYQATSVFFRKISEEEAWYYANSDEPMDKAGAYALQGAASAFIDRVSGCYSNVIGLPVSDTVRLLRAHGMKVMGI